MQLADPPKSFASRPQLLPMGSCLLLIVCMVGCGNDSKDKSPQTTTSATTSAESRSERKSTSAAESEKPAAGPASPDSGQPKAGPQTQAAGPAGNPAQPARSAQPNQPVSQSNQPTKSLGQAQTAAAPTSGVPEALISLSRQANAAQDNAGGQPWMKTSEPVDYWESQYLGGKRAGLTHVQIVPVGTDRVRVTSTTHTSSQRAGKTVQQTIAIESLERTNGVVENYNETQTDASGNQIVHEGVIIKGQLQLKRTQGKQVTSTTIAWPENTWGPRGLQQMLHRKPMAPGESRQSTIFMPQLHQIARVTMLAGQPEDTTCPEGLIKNATPIDALLQLEKEGIAIRMWLDSESQIRKTVWLEGFNFSEFRTTREVAERLESQDKIDLLGDRSVNVNPPLSNADQATSIVYKIESSEADPHRLLATGPNQAVRNFSTYKAELIVQRFTADGPVPEEFKQTPPGRECLEPNAVLCSKEPQIVALAAQLVGDERQPPIVAMKLTEGVFKLMRKKNFSRVFDSADIVANSLEGDCTEHAVLLATLLRSRDIPSRVASGLVNKKTETGSAMMYHMWTEAWLGDRWLPLDATLGGIAGCDHIKFLDSTLSDSNPYVAILPVLDSLGKLKISVGETK